MTSADPQLIEFYDIQLKMAGITTALYPAFGSIWKNSWMYNDFTATLALGKSPSGFPIQSVTSLNTSDGKNFTANAIGSLPVSATNVTQTLGIFDSTGNPVGRVQYKKNYINAADCLIQASGVFPDSLINSSYPVTVIYTFSQTIGGETVYGIEIITTQSYPKKITNLSPTDLNHNSQIKICLTRKDGDCDYLHQYDGNVSLPIKGNILYFGRIDVNNGVPINANSSIYIVRQSQGGSPIKPSGSFNFFSSPGTRIEGNQLSWDLDWLEFSPPDFNSGEMVYYVFKVTVQVEGQSVVCFITNAPDNVLPRPPILNTWRIKPMQIVYGCLGKDTRILMQDGTEKALGEIHVGEWVCGQGGQPLRVENVTTGHETQYLDITLDMPGCSSVTITTSYGHPFYTTSGVKLARELTLTDRLMAYADKECLITAITAQQQPIEVFNLHLSTDDAAQMPEQGHGTMYANGVLVGDSVAQQRYEDAYKQRPVNVLSQLPTQWQEDYRNYLATRQADTHEQ
ncbi:polymorphic toxin-type HINT domain-containing protein [Dickeya lacustris]|uniref:Polymorphic toxin-type HINT domain-containing protein n=1 Tax=Dickeya lacustris TaxID=2259638 RepID=A0ABY8G718_9GAMM|nr:polymorphic toxin-type HINT domain-containing protein [Dickeya lacustris]WFN55758.1 polymorphic toxin-type HINT domain-containing protein [Dickeya lacustris]